MLERDYKKCTICGKKKSSQSFAAHSNRCLLCQNNAQTDEDDDAGGGGKQLTNKKEVRKMAHAIELDLLREKYQKHHEIDRLTKMWRQDQKEIEVEEKRKEGVKATLEKKESPQKNSVHTDDPISKKARYQQATHLFTAQKNVALRARLQNSAVKQNTATFYQQTTAQEKAVKEEVEKLVQALHDVKNFFKK